MNHPSSTRPSFASSEKPLPSRDSLFDYLERDTLALIAWSTLSALWIAFFIFYNPAIQRLSTLWFTTAGIITAAGILALALNRRYFLCAVTVYSALLFLAGGVILYAFRDAQLLYFAIPIITLTGYLVGRRGSTLAALCMIALAGLGVQWGIPLSDIAVPVSLALFTAALSWISSYHFYITLDWSWASYLHSIEMTQEARQHRAELARVNKSLNDANERLHQMNKAYAEAWLAAEDAKRFKAQFAANISHELRTPLQIVVGFTETMLYAPESYGTSLPAAYRSDLMEVYQSSSHLLDLVDDVLDLSQIEEGHMGLVREQCSAADILHEAASLIRTSIERKGLLLQIHIPPNLPDVRVDRTRIRQIVLNLLNNAARYTARGEITLAAQLTGQALEVSIADTGPGIAPEHLRHIFDTYFQINASTRREQGGAGLGLAISKHFVEMHGGTIWASSRLGEGSCFTFTLPVAGPAEALMPPLSRTHSASPAWTGRGVERVLLFVHPDASMAHVLARHLESYRIMHVATVDAACEQAETLAPHAIVAGDAATATALVQAFSQRHGARRPSIPIITCPLPGGLLPVFAAGIQGYLAKPVTRQRLLSTMSSILPNGGRVLIVDDDPAMVRLLARIVRSALLPYTIQRAYDGNEALTLMQEHPPNLVLLDLYMPEHDGFHVLDHLNRSHDLAHIPVIVISAAKLPEDGIMHLTGSLSITRGQGLTLAETFRLLPRILDGAHGASEREVVLRSNNPSFPKAQRA